MDGHDLLPETLAAHLLETAILLGDRDAAAALSAPLSTFSSRLRAASWAALSSFGRLLGGAAALCGEGERARDCYRRALRVCQKVHFRPEIALIRLELAELLLTDGPGSEAAAHLDFAIGEFRDMKMQPALERAFKHKGLLHA